MKYCWLLITILFFSCNKENSCKECAKENSFKEATIINAGLVAADGCDWGVKIGDTFYHPDQLDASLKQNNLPVKVCYEETPDRFMCGFNPVGIPVIRVICIKKQA